MKNEKPQGQRMKKIKRRIGVYCESPPCKPQAQPGVCGIINSA
jgi:hypothetical protein